MKREGSCSRAVGYVEGWYLLPSESPLCGIVFEAGKDKLNDLTSALSSKRVAAGSVGNETMAQFAASSPTIHAGRCCPLPSGFWIIRYETLSTDLWPTTSTLWPKSG